MKTIDTAMGPEKGDYLEVANQWSRVILSRADPKFGDAYMVSGDCETRRLPTPEAAMNYVLEVMGLSQEGRHPPASPAGEDSSATIGGEQT